MTSWTDTHAYLRWFRSKNCNKIP